MLDRRRRAGMERGESVPRGQALAAGRRMRTDRLGERAVSAGDFSWGAGAAAPAGRAGWGSPLGIELAAPVAVAGVAGHADGVEQAADGGELVVDAAEYLRHNQLEAKSENGRALGAVSWPEPHPRLGWRDQGVFTGALLAALDRCPADIERALQAVRATTPSATIVHDPATGRTRLALGDLSLVIHARRPHETGLRELGETHEVAGGAERTTEALLRRLKTVPMVAGFTGEHLPGNEVWQGSQVTYLSATERQAFKLNVRDGKIYDASGKLFDTADAASVHRDGAGRAIAVMDADGNLYASKHQEVGWFHHSSLMAGEPVAYAGEITVEDGVLVEISNQSGHYLPPQASLDQVRQVLESSGVDFSVLKVIRMGSPTFPGE